MKVIEVNDLVVGFGDKVVLDGLSFEVNKGEIFGLLGGNGSGKTTTLRTLLNFYKPTSGTALINGRRFDSEVTRVGYLPEERGLYVKERVLDVMTYFGRLKGVRGAAKWSKRYLERVGLADKMNERLEKLSSGQQQKVQLGITIIDAPGLLILDEPTKGFDPVNRRLLMDIIEERRQAGATIVLITHYMEEVERLCDRAILLKDGKARAYGTIQEIKKKFGEKSLDQVFIDIYGEEEV
ncbi:ATP-binding cassette domain-containing protein [Candidatus Saccharibacteria bacterium]|nr:ATP-binding cassette domain-containing protein [Candidatus Saccharibacteria bacterium]